MLRHSCVRYAQVIRTETAAGRWSSRELANATFNAALRDSAGLIDDLPEAEEYLNLCEAGETQIVMHMNTDVQELTGQLASTPANAPNAASVINVVEQGLQPWRTHPQFGLGKAGELPALSSLVTQLDAYKTQQQQAEEQRRQQEEAQQQQQQQAAAGGGDPNANPQGAAPANQQDPNAAPPATEQAQPDANQQQQSPGAPTPELNVSPELQQLMTRKNEVLAILDQEAARVELMLAPFKTALEAVVSGITDLKFASDGMKDFNEMLAKGIGEFWFQHIAEEGVKATIVGAKEWGDKVQSSIDAINLAGESGIANRSFLPQIGRWLLGLSRNEIMNQARQATSVNQLEEIRGNLGTTLADVNRLLPSIETLAGASSEGQAKEQQINALPEQVSDASQPGGGAPGPQAGAPQAAGQGPQPPAASTAPPGPEDVGPTESELAIDIMALNPERPSVHGPAAEVEERARRIDENAHKIKDPDLKAKLRLWLSNAPTNDGDLVYAIDSIRSAVGKLSGEVPGSGFVGDIRDSYERAGGGVGGVAAGAVATVAGASELIETAPIALADSISDAAGTARVSEKYPKFSMAIKFGWKIVTAPVMGTLQLFTQTAKVAQGTNDVIEKSASLLEKQQIAKELTAQVDELNRARGAAPGAAP